jgi:hypothetical protein
LTHVNAGAETAWHKLNWEDVTMLIDPTVPHIGIYMPAEIRHLRKVVRKIMASEPTSSRSEEISVGVARRVFDAYNSGSMEMEELLDCRASSTLSSGRASYCS